MLIHISSRIPMTTALGAELFALASSGSQKEIAALLDEHKGAAPADRALVDTCNKNGETALMEASFQGHLELVKFLLSRGADVNLRDRKYGNTAVMWASVKGRTAVIEELVLRHRADVNVQGHHGSTALLEAALGNHFGTVEFLVGHGANVRLKDEVRISIAALFCQ